MPDAPANGQLILPNGATTGYGDADIRKLRNPPMFVEVGSTGLERYDDNWATIHSEFVPQLSSSDLRFRTYREMSLNDPIIGAGLAVIDLLVRRIDWRVEPASDKPQDRERAEFVESCMDDMADTWTDFVSEVMSMLVHGWSYFEICYKRRRGDNRFESFSSQHDDGKVGWRKIRICGQGTLQAWMFDRRTKDLLAMRQLAPPEYSTEPVPYAKALLFRTTTARGNPEGQSILRKAYPTYYRLKRYLDLEGIGHARDLTGIPMMKVPSSMLSDAATPEEVALRAKFRQMMSNVRQDTQAGIMIPNDVDPATKLPLYEFGMISSPGSRITNLPDSIVRLEQRIAGSMLTDFLLLGQNSAGSFALSSDKTSLFMTALDAYTGVVGQQFNRRAIPKLLRANGWDPHDAPQIKPVQVKKPNLAEIGQYLQQITAAGAPIFPNNELLRWLFSAAEWPDLTDEMIEEQEQAKLVEMERQQQSMVAAAEAKAAASGKGPGGPDGTANAKPAGGAAGNGQQALNLGGDKPQPAKRDNPAPTDSRPKRPARGGAGA